MIRVLIVDDEAPARRKMRRLLGGEGDVEIVGEAASGEEAVAAIRDLAPELVFLDIRMPGLDGFGVIEEVGVEAMPAVVFVTAHDEHALEAFEIHALDYLLKPVRPERVSEVLERVRRNADTAGLAARLDEVVRALAPGRRPLRRILVHGQDRSFFVSVDDIVRLEARRNYVRLHIRDGTRHTIRATLATLEERLDPDDFLRIHRSEIVRLDAIRELQPWFHGDHRVVLEDGTKLMWSRRYRARSKRALGDLA